MDSLLNTTKESYALLLTGQRGLSVLGAVEGGCRRLELGVGFVSFLQNLLGFIAGQALLSGELEGLEAGMGGACLHLSITSS